MNALFFFHDQPSPRMKNWDFSTARGAFLSPVFGHTECLSSSDEARAGRRNVGMTGTTAVGPPPDSHWCLLNAQGCSYSTAAA